MNDRIQDLINQIAALEKDLGNAINEHEANVAYQIKGKRIEFEHSIKQAHALLKQGFFHWLVTNRPQNLITGPIIYSMIIPIVILDLCVSFYQMTCFPIYGIAKLKRSDYIVLDRQHLEYLNFIEKFHCTYCAYASGLIAYVFAIIGKTEQYFCPIKHARKILGTHPNYTQFLRYGEAENYKSRLEEHRKKLSK